MFVATGSQARLARKRRDQFEAEYVHPLIAEAAKLGVTQAQLVTMIQAAPIYEGDTK
jgi:DNA-binding transcriptional regulator YhcF (GntR family)